MSYVGKLLLSVMLCEIICGQGNNMDRRRSCLVKRSSRNRSSGQKSGMSVLNHDMIFPNEELRNYSESLGQVIVVDSGCPRSLL